LISTERLLTKTRLASKRMRMKIQEKRKDFFHLTWPRVSLISWEQSEQQQREEEKIIRKDKGNVNRGKWGIGNIKFWVPITKEGCFGSNGKQLVQSGNRGTIPVK